MTIKVAIVKLKSFLLVTSVVALVVVVVIVDIYDY